MHPVDTPPSPTTRPTVLVIEDDVHARTLAARVADAEGCAVMEAASAGRALELLRGRPVDIVLLDLGLPDRDGLSLLTDIRRTSRAPTIVISADARVTTRVAGLRLGADDYLVKPVTVDELGARLHAALRRRAPTPHAEQLVPFGPFVVDLRAHEVRRHGVPVSCTPRELALLAFFVQHPRQAFHRRQLLDAVWADEWVGPSTVTEHVRTLRRKLGEPPARPRWIATVRGVGYRFDP